MGDPKPNTQREERDTQRHDDGTLGTEREVEFCPNAQSFFCYFDERSFYDSLKKTEPPSHCFSDREYLSKVKENRSGFHLAMFIKQHGIEPGGGNTHTHEGGRKEEPRELMRVSSSMPPHSLFPPTEKAAVEGGESGGISHYPSWECHPRRRRVREGRLYPRHDTLQRGKK